MDSGWWRPSSTEIVWAMFTRTGVVSSDKEDVGEGQRQIKEIDCTRYHVCGGVEILCHKRDLMRGVNAVS